jgi:integrase
MARGSIEQRSPGTWSIRVELLPDPQTGKRRQKRTTFKGTKREAEKRLSEMLHQLDTGSFVNPAKLTVGDFLRQWLRDYVETGVRATTKEGYQIIIEKHLVPNLGSIALSQLQPTHLQAYYSKALKEGRSDGKGGLSARTVKHHHRVLSEALNHAVRWGLVGRNVALAVDPPRTEDKEMQVLNGAGITRLLEAAQGTVYYPAIHLAVFTGMRRSEILGLRWRDLDMDGNTLAVNQVLHVLPGGSVIFQKPKTDRSHRTVTLGPAAVLALKAHREKVEATRAMLESPLMDDGLVFSDPATGKPMLPNTLTHAFTKIARMAGLNVRLHDLRHTHISQLIRQGIYPKAIADRVGHSTISTTMDIYGHLFTESQREAAIKFELGLVTPAQEEAPIAP